MIPTSTPQPGQLSDHGICEAARQCDCVCGAACGQPCNCAEIGVHMARVARARRFGFLGSAEFAQAIHDADVFTGLTVLIDPAGAA